MKEPRVGLCIFARSVVGSFPAFYLFPSFDLYLKSFDVFHQAMSWFMFSVSTVMQMVYVCKCVGTMSNGHGGAHAYFIEQFLFHWRTQRANERLFTNFIAFWGLTALIRIKRIGLFDWRLCVMCVCVRSVHAVSGLCKLCKIESNYFKGYFIGEN